MNARVNAFSKFTIIIAVLASFITFGCSSDDSSPTGPSGSGSAPKIDEITVTLGSIFAKYDCDFDPVGVTSPGDFRYNINVDTLSSNGDWVSASKNNESSVSINTGNSATVSKSATFRLVRSDGQAFRVRLSIREIDGSSNDFSSSTSIIHVYHDSDPQVYGPQNSVFSSYSTSTQRGTMNWTVNKRDRTWALGVLVGEGCNVTMNYSVVTKAL
ncbi:MAG: hypothetical protein R3F48_02975 [Candidatus Zixiibacteriota bacterium]